MFIFVIAAILAVALCKKDTFEIAKFGNGEFAITRHTGLIPTDENFEQYRTKLVTPVLVVPEDEAAEDYKTATYLFEHFIQKTEYVSKVVDGPEVENVVNVVDDSFQYDVDFTSKYDIVIRKGDTVILKAHFVKSSNGLYTAKGFTESGFVYNFTMYNQNYYKLEIMAENNEYVVYDIHRRLPAQQQSGFMRFLPSLVMSGVMFFQMKAQGKRYQDQPQVADGVKEDIKLDGKEEKENEKKGKKGKKNDQQAEEESAVDETATEKK